MQMNEKPVILTMDKVTLLLEEPESIRALPPRQPKKKKASIPGKNTTLKGLSNFVRDMTVIINEAHFIVKLLPRAATEGSTPWAPQLRFDLYDIQIVSTNGQWDPKVKLSKTTVKHETKPKVEVSYKLVMCRSLSVALLSTPNLQVIENLPVEIHVVTETATSSKQTLGVDLHCILDQLHFSYTQQSWGMVVQVFSSLRFCLERDIPREIKVESETAIKKRKKKVSNTLDNME